MEAKQSLRIAMVGRPNTGKSTLFNQLTGMNQKVSNYPGVTMERTSGLTKLAPGQLAEIIDLPGIYSLHPSSADEAVVMDSLLNVHEEGEVDVVIGVADGTNLKTCLFVFSQVLDLGIPAVLVITMADDMAHRGLVLDHAALGESLGCEVLIVNARTGEGMEAIQPAIIRAKASPHAPFFQPGGIHLQWLAALQEGDEYIYKTWLRSLSQPAHEAKIRESGRGPKRLRADEAIQRYRQVNRWLGSFLTSYPEQDRRFSTKVDRLLVHPLWGSVVLFGLLFVIFQALFYGSEGPMVAIDEMITSLSQSINAKLPGGFFTHMITHGLMPGITGGLMFVPQIAMLFGFIALLEESGYMSRVVFMMDRFMRPFGLSGKSVVPMISGTACAIPAILSTRNMEDGRERWLAIAVTPFITCSARIPVYALIIGLVIPDMALMGINLRGLVLFGLYFLGFAAALAAAALLNRWKRSQVKVKVPDFLLEMPEYRWPQPRNVGMMIWRQTSSFVKEAGKIIVAISVILWFAASFGPDHAADFTQDRVSVPIEESYIGIAGQFIEPVMRPLGYDWKISVAILSSFVAREVFVGTMATLYSVGDEGIESIHATLASQINPETGEAFFSLPMGISLLLFYAFAMQCMSTLVVVARESRSWTLALTQFVLMSLFAYVVAWAAFVALS